MNYGPDGKNSIKYNTMSGNLKDLELKRLRDGSLKLMEERQYALLLRQVAAGEEVREGETKGERQRERREGGRGVRERGRQQRGGRERVRDERRERGGEQRGGRERWRG